MDTDVAGNTQVVLDVDGAADLGRIANRRPYPGTMAIEIRAGLCDPTGELAAGLKRSGRRRITARRRGMRSSLPPGGAMTTPGSLPTMAPADLLIGLLDRVPLSEAQIARATLADPATIQAWLRRRQAPAGLEAQRVTELVAFVEEMARNIRGDAPP